VCLGAWFRLRLLGRVVKQCAVLLVFWVRHPTVSSMFEGRSSAWLKGTNISETTILMTMVLVVRASVGCRGTSAVVVAVADMALKTDL
jgi:hypothetical protein